MIDRSILAALAALGIACTSSSKPAYGAPPDPEPRSKMVLSGDPVANLARIRENARLSGCSIEERSNGTFITCGDVTLWFVPDANGMEITCTGLAVNCGRRTRELLKVDGDAGSD